MTVIKDWALIEPMVTTLRPNNGTCLLVSLQPKLTGRAVITEEVVVLKLDLSTATIDDLDFETSFSLQSMDAGTLQILAGYFTVFFPGPVSNGRPLAIRTGPGNLYTHWKQTAFLVEPPLELIAPGQEVHISMTVNKNDANPRDLDIDVDFEIPAAGGKDKQTQTHNYRLR